MPTTSTKQLNSLTGPFLFLGKQYVRPNPSLYIHTLTHKYTNTRVHARAHALINVVGELLLCGKGTEIDTMSSTTIIVTTISF